MKKAPTVHVVDDDRAILDSLSALLESAGYSARIYDAAEKFLAVDSVDPGCLILDVRMPRMNGYELFERVQERHPDLPVVFLSAHGQIRPAVEAIKRGAVDFLEKPVSNDELLERVGAAIEHGRRLREEKRQRRETREQIGNLTARERETLADVCEGHKSREIAEKMGIAVKTVEVHRSHIMQKMHATNVADLVRRVADAGVKPEELRRKR